MWSRVQLKENAKIALRRGYWISFAVCLVASLLGGSSPTFQMSYLFGPGSSTRYNRSYNWPSGYGYSHRGFSFPNLFAFSVVTVIFLLVVAVSIAVVLFLSNPLKVGKSRYFITARNSHNDFGILFSTFERGSYFNVVKTLFFTDLKIFLWSLLFVIPGVVKSYAYRMVPCILAENPYLDSQRAMEISEQMMMGEKWDTFVLDLSFMGWFFLGALACGIGTWFVLPYVESTEIELYGVLRYKAIQSGICHPSELGEFPAAQ